MKSLIVSTLFLSILVQASGDEDKGYLDSEFSTVSFGSAIKLAVFLLASS
jgi:hypothetical protein